MRPLSTLPGRSASDEAARCRVPAINGLRGIAILAVIYFHLIAGVWHVDNVPFALSPLLTNGWTGVNLFFMLSGFVLFLPYAFGDRPLASVADRLAFYRHRFLRLLPLFYVAMLVEWVVARRFGDAIPSELLSVASLTFILDPASFCPRFNPGLWSIGVEIAFSLLFPILVELAWRFGLLRFCGIVAVLALLIRLGGIARYPALSGANFNSDMFLCRLDEFVLGMGLAQLYVKHRLPRHAGHWALAGIVLVGFAWTGFDLVLRGVLPPISRAILNDVLDAGLFAIVSVSLNSRSRLAAALAWRPLQVLGIMCYSLYIWHGPLLRWVMSDRASVTGEGTYLLALLFYFALTLTIAGFSYRFIEFTQARPWCRLFLLDARTDGAPRSASGAVPR